MSIERSRRSNRRVMAVVVGMIGMAPRQSWLTYDILSCTLQITLNIGSRREAFVPCMVVFLRDG